MLTEHPDLDTAQLGLAVLKPCRSTRSSGCAAHMARHEREMRVAWVREHGRSYPPEIQQAIIDGCVQDDMTVRQAEAAWGEALFGATEIRRTTLAGREVLQYFYTQPFSDPWWLLVEDGRVIASH